MDGIDLQAAMIRFHLLRAEEGKGHLEALRIRLRELFPNMNETKADRLLAVLDEEVTRANIRWLESAVNDPKWPRTADTWQEDEPKLDTQAS